MKPPPVLGGQGRTAESLIDSAVWLWAMFFFACGCVVGALFF